MSLAKKCLKYNLPHSINDTTELVLGKLLLTVYVDMRIAEKSISYKYIKTYLQYLIVTYAS